MASFIDKVKINIKAGSGGNGLVAFRREKYIPKGGPAGGDGGMGGDVYLVAKVGMTTLMDFKYKSVFKAQDGQNGRNKSQYGKQGEDLYIKVPIGTVVKDLKNGKIVADLINEDQTVLIAKGGRGGRGNIHFATSTKRAPQYCEPGEEGVERLLELELKLIADVGIIGFPNAGKSTLISVISSAKPKIADYPFTTLIPNLGVVRKPDGGGFVVADIPGLIEGASDGVGLGHDFLRHIQRCRFLIHLVDLTEKDPITNYNKINEELKRYSASLSEVKQVIALNKIDSVDVEKQEKCLQEFKKYSDDVFLISSVTKEGLGPFVNFLYTMVDRIEQHSIEVEVEEDLGVYDNNDEEYTVEKVSKDTYSVCGIRINRLANITDMKNLDQLQRLRNILDAMGVLQKLKEKGIKEGDTILISKLELLFYG